MISLKNKWILGLLLLLFALPLHAKWLGLMTADRKEFIQARATYDAGNYEQAIEQLSQYIYKTKNIKRREARAYRLLGICYEKLNHPEKALDVYSEALEFHRKNIPLLLAAANLYQRTHLVNRSIDLYNRVLELDPDNTHALAGLAKNYIDMGFYSKAISYYDRFFSLTTDVQPVQLARYAYAFFKQRDFKHSFINITLAKEAEPYNADYWLLSARSYKGLQMHPQALADLNIAIWLTPQKTELRMIKAMWLYQMNRYKESEQETRAVLTQEPKNELAHFMLYMNLKNTRPQEARKHLQKIKSQGTNTFAERVAAKLLEK